MAPEVIMQLQYTAKADLWSIGTIVFQCLTGEPPYNAGSPGELKGKYERHPKLVPNIPAGTSSNLRDLLLRLLKRNPKDRIEFDAFFRHPFITGKSEAVNMPSSASKTSLARSPAPQVVSESPLSARMSSTPPHRPSLRGGSHTPRLSHKPALPEPIELSTHDEAEECDGFVIVEEKSTGTLKFASSNMQSS